MKTLIYADNAATTKIDDAVLEGMLPWLKDGYGNASSLYSLGMASRKAVRTSREAFASAIHAEPEEIFFTSGGSESDNWALKGITEHIREGNHIITSSIEHPAILNTCKALDRRNYNVTYLPVNQVGRVSVSDVKAAVNSQTILISIMMANNEVGTVEPIAEICQFAKGKGIRIHSDAVQAIGHLPIDVTKLSVDALSFSAHKFYGPKGIGVLYLRRDTPIYQLIDGGHQEFGMRAGTENVAGIVGAGIAIELMMTEFDRINKNLTDLSEQTICKLKETVPDIVIHGDSVHHLPGIINLSFPGILGEQIMNLLDLQGICVSTGSACNSGQQKSSHVLHAMHISEKEAQGSIRISFGKNNKQEEADRIVEALSSIYKKLKKRE